MDEKWLRSGTAQFNKEEREVYAALQYAASCDCLVAEWHDCEEHKPKPKEQSGLYRHNMEAKTHRTVWRAATRRYRCIRCGRNSNEVAREARGSKVEENAIQRQVEKMGKAHLGEHDTVRRVDRLVRHQCGAGSVRVVRDAVIDQT